MKDADFLIELARGKAQFFSTGDGKCYADIVDDGHRQTLPIAGHVFNLWLRNQYFKERPGQAVPPATLKTFISTLEAVTICGSGQRHEVHLRLARKNDSVYLDLCDPGHTVIEVTARGWGIILDAPVRFRWAEAMMPLPLPTSGGSIDLLRPFVNLDDRGFTLLVCSLVDALIVDHPHPVLFIAGEEGSAETTLAKLARSLFDPSKVLTKNLPGTVRNLFVEVENSYGLVFDNVSKLPQAISDGLCMVATGSGLSERTLYSNKEMSLLGGGTHPVWLTGLRNVITRSDLADRAIILDAHYVTDTRRKDEAEVYREFEVQRPLILGALLDLVRLALRNLPTVRPAVLPRMADFARIAIACETGFVEPGSFARAYAASAKEAALVVIEEELTGVGQAALAYIRRYKKWRGTATELMVVLNQNDLTEECVTKNSKWPKDPKSLGSALTEATPALRKNGCVITRSRVGKAQTRIIDMRWAPPERRHADKADKDKNMADKQTTYKSNNAGAQATVFNDPHNDLYGRKA